MPKAAEPAADPYPMLQADNSFDDPEATAFEIAGAPAKYVTAASEREFSIYEAPSEPMPMASFDDKHPYVPASTLDFTFVEDTTVPKVIVPSVEEVRAREAMERAMAALDEIDWLKLQKELAVSGNKMDMAKLQEELKKALETLNWKKINTALQEKE